MKIIVDANIAIKWVILENHSHTAYQLLAGDYEICAPDFLFVEVVNILWKKCRKKEIPQADVLEIFLLIQSSISQVLPVYPLISRIFALSQEIDHPAYDCVYLAAAEHHKTTLYTADRALYDKIKMSKYAHLIAWIEDLPSK